MNRKITHTISSWLPVAVLLSALLACSAFQAVVPATEISGQNIPPTAEGGQVIPPTTEPSQSPSAELPTSTPISHTLIPGESPTGGLSEISDRDSSVYASEHRANGGEVFSGNLYERPFNANSMDKYFPDLDITRTRLSRDEQWVFVIVKLVGQDPAGGLNGDYGVELDLNVDGRGDVFVMAAKPGSVWSTDGVRAWKDDNHDVGATHPIQSDAPENGNGYETLVFDQGVGVDPDLAWARISPSDPNSVEVAFKRGLINDDDIFTWGAWAMSDAMLNPAWFDYNDHFTAAEAGSPLTELTQYYPIKALAEVDNTCRWSVGFTPTGSEPGICPVPPTPTPELPGTVSGTVYDNGINGGLVYKPSSIPRSGITVTIRSGGCGSPGGIVATTTTNGSGQYLFTVPAGTYCVSAATPSSHQTNPQTVTVPNGGSVPNVDFFYWTYIGM